MPPAGHKKTPQVCVAYGVPRQMAGLYSVVPLNFENLLLVLLHPQPVLKRFSGNADHVSNPDRLKLAGVCELIGRGFSNAENSGDVLHGVGSFFGVCFPPDALIICLLFLVGILPIPARFP